MAEPRPILKPESIGRECEASLRRLGVERIDEAFSEKHLACTVHKLGSFGSLKFPCGFAHAHEAQESYGEERRSAVSTAGWQLKPSFNIFANRLRVATRTPRNRGHGQSLAVKVQDHHQFSELDHRHPLSESGRME